MPPVQELSRAAASKDQRPYSSGYAHTGVSHGAGTTGEDITAVPANVKLPHACVPS